MIPHLVPGTTYAVHLRAPSSSGGKDWVGSITSAGEIHTYWGKTGQINQHAAKPGTITALHKIINQKKTGKDNYREVDEFSDQQGWQSQRKTHGSSGVTQPAPITSAMDWEQDAPADSIHWDF